MYSLVTACMNREAHLRRAIPSWLRLPRVAEIVIVDWSNDRPLTDLVSLDPRLRVIRVEHESRWVLSYAYNLGIQEAHGPLVFKCDADCLPRPEVTQFLAPGESHFLAGNWRSGTAKAKLSVNGQCLVSKTQFEQVNGYSEYIRTWGRDDEDFYERLACAGFERREIRESFLDFIEHGDAERVSHQFGLDSPASVEEAISRSPAFQEMFNASISKQLPWGPERPRAVYVPVAHGDRWKVVRRDHTSELPRPVVAETTARLFALRKLAALWTEIAWSDAEQLNEQECLFRITSFQAERNGIAQHGGPATS